jgi:prepilin peptidase CpaA
MTVFTTPTLLVLGVTSATLVWVGLTDFKEFKIRNNFVILLAVCYLVYALVSGHWTTMYWNVGFALLVGVGMIYAYSQDQIGGGDMKLLTVAFLWTGPRTALPFSILLVICVAIHYLAARFDFVPVKQSPMGRRIPLGPSVAAALIGTFALGFPALWIA